MAGAGGVVVEGMAGGVVAAPMAGVGTTTAGVAEAPGTMAGTAGVAAAGVQPAAAGATTAAKMGTSPGVSPPLTSGTLTSYHMKKHDNVKFKNLETRKITIKKANWLPPPKYHQLEPLLR